MANISITIGNETVSKEFTNKQEVLLTNTEARQALILFIQGWSDPMPEGLTAAQQQTWLLQQSIGRIREEMARIILHAKRENRRQQRDLEDAQDEHPI